MGMFDDLVPKAPQKQTGMFDDLVPSGGGGVPPAAPAGPAAAPRAGGGWSATDAPAEKKPDPTAQPFAGTNRINPVNAVPRVLDYGGNYREAVEGSVDTMARGLQSFREGGWYGRTKGALQMGAGAVGYVSSPFTALLKTGVGDPTTRITGSRKAGDLTEFGAGVLIPGGPAAKAGDVAAGTKVGKTAEKIFSPTTVDANAGAAEATIRSATGRAARDTESTANALKGNVTLTSEENYRLVNSLDDNARRDFISYVENRSKGAVLADKRLQGLADEMRNAYELRKTKLSNLSSHAQQSFIDDYYPHTWENAGKGTSSVGPGMAAKQGSGSFTKGRTIPTLEDGLQQGLVPKTMNPIEATMAYVANADRFIAMNEAIEEGVTQGAVRYMPVGKQPGGWVELSGRLGRKANGDVAYAPEGWARVWNNYASGGVKGEYKDAYDMARHASNSVTALELGLSGFHATTMAFEGMVNQVAKGVGEIRGGKLLEGLKSIGKAPAAPVTLWRQGRKVEQAYLEGTNNPAMKQMTDLLAEAGGRGSGIAHAQDYQFSGMGSYWTAFKQGGLTSQLAADKAAIGSARGMIGKPAVAAARFGKNIGRVLDTVSKPLFQDYIPQIKNGAFYENMGSWLAQHPGATHEEQVAAARQIVDSIDNRFGEMIQDNVFWNKGLKQAAMLAMRSYSWNLGTVREIGGGLKDIAKGEWSQRSDYVVALAITTAVGNMTYQYLKTGEPPKDMNDLVAPRTGGTDAATGLPERLAPVGYMKDVFGWYRDPVQEAKNKMSTAMRFTLEMGSGTDWRGKPIAPPSDPDAGWQQNVPEHLAYWAKHVADTFGPISMKSMGAKPGSNIGPVSRVFGLREANRQSTDPEGFDDMMQKIRRNEWRKKLKSDERQNSLYGGGE